ATSGLAMGLVTQYQGIDTWASPIVKTQSDFTWMQDANGNSYISRTDATADPGQSYAVTARTEQTVDVNGNVTQVKNYAYGNLSTPARTTNYSYLGGSSYTSRYILNRLTSAVLTDGTMSVTLVTNSYDQTTPANVTGLRQWDSAMQSVTARGNVTA